MPTWLLVLTVFSAGSIFGLLVMGVLAGGTVEELREENAHLKSKLGWGIWS